MLLPCRLCIKCAAVPTVTSNLWQHASIAWHGPHIMASLTCDAASGNFTSSTIEGDCPRIFWSQVPPSALRRYAFSDITHFFTLVRRRLFESTL